MKQRITVKEKRNLENKQMENVIIFNNTADEYK
jgi:hypothetical protein